MNALLEALDLLVVLGITILLPIYAIALPVVFFVVL